MITNPSPKATRRQRLRRIGIALGSILGGLLWVGCTAATAAPAIAGVPQTAVERTIAALVSDHPETALVELPTGFEATMGYRPVLEDGRPVNPTGDCSSPIGLPAQFEPLCRSHDFGYDLLRFAAAEGNPAAPWARRALDAALTDAMSASCASVLCSLSARLADAGLAANSWRQHWGEPIAESGTEAAANAILTAVTTIAGRS